VSADLERGARAGEPRIGDARPLVPASRGRGELEIREFVDAEYAAVVTSVSLVCGSAAVAEDAVQEALARAWEQYARGRDIERLGAWITTVALNLVRSQFRRWRVERDARPRLVHRPETRDEATVSADVHAVRQALARLPRRQREVTVLRYYRGLDVTEIAAWLGIADGTVKALLFRARQTLADALDDDEAER
jgi:RNA polymerase sigma factor (sigma-70 family)